MTNKIFSKILVAAFSSALITFLLVSAVFLWVYKTDFQNVLSLVARYSYIIAIIIISITAVSLIAAHAVTKRIVKPIEKMGTDLKNISEN